MDSESIGPFFGLGLLVHALEKSSDAVEINDIAGDIIYVNGSWQQLFSHDEGNPLDSTGRRIYVSPLHSHKFQESWRQALLEARSCGEFYIRQSETSKRISYSRTLYRSSEGVATAVVNIYRLIGEEASVAPYAKMNQGDGCEEELGEFKHDMRNVFTGILGIVQITLGKDIEDDSLRNRLDYIQTAAHSGMERLDNW